MGHVSQVASEHLNLSPEELGRWQAKGALLILPEQLARIGGGDPRKGRRELMLMLAAEKDHKVNSGPATEKPACVRLATEADEKAVFDLIMADLKENAAHIAPIDPAKVVQHIFAATKQRGGIMGVIDGPAGAPVALVLLLPQQWWWSKSYYVQEQITYVHPDHRKSNHFNDLLAFSRWVADTWTVSFGYRIYMLCGVLGVHRIREKIVAYRRKYRLAGAAFLYPAPPDMGA